jgi:hypothetical protein
MIQFRTSQATLINQTIVIQNLLTHTSIYHKILSNFPTPYTPALSPSKSPHFSIFLICPISAIYLPISRYFSKLCSLLFSSSPAPIRPHSPLLLKLVISLLLISLISPGLLIIIVSFTRFTIRGELQMFSMCVKGFWKESESEIA